MSELVSKLNANDLTVFLFVGSLAILGALVGIIALLAHHWHRVRVAEMEIALKQQMLDKGMSAADIVQVLKASRDSGEAEAAGAKDFNAVRAELVETLVEHELPAADIELILQALQDDPEGAAKNAESIANMAEQGMTGADIARVVRAMKPPIAGGAIRPAEMVTATPPMTN